MKTKRKSKWKEKYKDRMKLGISYFRNGDYTLSQIKICVVGLGYVGLPLAVEFGKKRSVIGFDKDNKRIQELNNSYDKTSEISSDEIKEASFLELTSNESDISDCNCLHLRMVLSSCCSECRSTYLEHCSL